MYAYRELPPFTNSPDFKIVLNPNFSTFLYFLFLFHFRVFIITLYMLFFSGFCIKCTVCLFVFCCWVFFFFFFFLFLLLHFYSPLLGSGGEGNSKWFYSITTLNFDITVAFFIIHFPLTANCHLSSWNCIHWYIHTNNLKPFSWWLQSIYFDNWYSLSSSFING